MQLDSPAISHDSRRNLSRIGLSRVTPWGYWIGAALLLLGGLALRFHQLRLPIERDYDEGVYWASLKAMHAGGSLFSEVFSSQPPLFLILEYPFTFFGSGVQSARLGIFVFSFVGLVGIFLIGRAVGGGLGGLVALGLLGVSPAAVAGAHVLQADSASIAIAALAVGLALLWWKYPNGVRGGIIASSAALCLVAAMSVKFLAAPAVIPVMIVVIARLWLLWRRRVPITPATVWPLGAAAITAVVCLAAIYLPFTGNWHQLYSQVVQFHLDAAHAGRIFPADKEEMFRKVLVPTLGFAALAGITLGALRKQFLLIPLLGWLTASAAFLWHLNPLFSHHMITLVPPVIGLVSLAFSPASELQIRRRYWRWAFVVAQICVLIVVVNNGLDSLHKDRQYYRQVGDPGPAISVASDLRHVTRPSDLVVTDDQFISGLADRNVPAQLVDLSSVRVFTGYIKESELISLTSQSRVHAVLFYRGVFYGKPLDGFHSWVASHFLLVKSYGKGRELWVRN